jgi:integrase
VIGAFMATIEKRVNNQGVVTYRVRIRMRGHPQESATFSKISDAKAWAVRMGAAVQEGRYFKDAQARRRTLGQLITRYQTDILPYKSTNQHFLSGQHKQLDWWKKQLGAYYLSEVTASRIVEARSLLQVSPATVNRYMAALSHVFSVGVREWEWLESSPTRKITKLKEARGRVRYLSDDERLRLFMVLKERGDATLELIVTLAIATGARKGELLGLRWSDVDFERCRMVFEDTKNGDRRAASLGEHALKMLKAHHAQVHNSMFLFPGNRGTPVRIDREFRELLRVADISNFRFHDLRHCTASYLAMNGATLLDIAHILGHKTLSMVKRYAHLSDSHTSSVVEKMNAAIF